MSKNDSVREFLWIQDRWLKMTAWESLFELKGDVKKCIQFIESFRDAAFRHESFDTVANLRGRHDLVGCNNGIGGFH